MHINSHNLLGALILGALTQLSQSQVSEAGLWEVSSKSGGSAEIDTAMAICSSKWPACRLSSVNKWKP